MGLTSGKLPEASLVSIAPAYLLGEVPASTVTGDPEARGSMLDVVALGRSVVGWHKDRDEVYRRELRPSVWRTPESGQRQLSQRAHGLAGRLAAAGAHIVTPGFVNSQELVDKGKKIAFSAPVALRHARIALRAATVLSGERLGDFHVRIDEVGVFSAGEVPLVGYGEGDGTSGSWAAYHAAVDSATLVYDHHRVNGRHPETCWSAAVMDIDTAVHYPAA